MPVLTRNNFQIRYGITGNGPPLILISGLGMPMQGWAFQVRPLARHFTVVRLDNRGCGRSDVPSTPWSVADMAGDVLGLMDHLGLERVHIAGMSMGGFIALELALAAQKRIRSLVLAHTTPRLPALSISKFKFWIAMREAGVPGRVQALEQMIWMYPGNMLEKVHNLETLARNLAVGQRAQSLAGFKGQVAACRDFDVTHRLPEIRVPALVISSEDDLSIPLSYSRMLTDLPGFRKLHIFPSAGHVSHLVCREAFNREILDFLLSPDQTIT